MSTNPPEAPNTQRKFRLKPDDSLLVIDFYEDRHKFRWIFPLSTLFVFIFMVFTIFTSQPLEQKSPSKVELDLEPANFQVLGHEKFNVRQPLIKVLDRNNNPLEGVSIYIKPVHFTTSVRNDRPKCDYELRLANAGTYDVLRIFDVCKFTINGKEGKSDEIGEVKFPNFRIENGPEGIYQLEYYYNENIKSTPITIFFQSDAFHLELLNSPQSMIDIGHPFNPQPSVRILNSSHLPLEGKRVVALVWPEPSLNLEEGLHYYIQNNKYAILENFVSKESDSDGIANFSNLTFVGSMNTGFYIIFVCDGSILASWHYPISMHFEIHKLPLLKQPIWVNLENYKHHQILINSNELPLDIMEGIILDPQPKITIQNIGNGTGLKGIPFFAVLAGYEENGVEYYFPHEFQYQEEGTYNKRLFKPIAAKYNENYSDPFADWLYKPYLTDQEGNLHFEGLAFTVQGNLGEVGVRKYAIKFASNGEKSDAYKINVHTSIDSITFVDPLENVYNQDIHKTYEIFALIHIRDKESNGVPGKSVYEIAFVDVSRQHNPDIILKLLTDYSSDAYSDTDGFLPILIKLQSMSTHNKETYHIHGLIKVMIDGIVAYSSETNLWPSSSLEGCFALKMIESIDIKEAEYIQNIEQIFTKTIKVQAIDNIGLPVADVNLTFTPMISQYVSISKQPPPKSFMELDENPISKIEVLTDSDGYAIFDQINVIHALFGTYFYNIIGKTKVSSLDREISVANSCMLSKPLPIFMNNKIKEIKTIGPNYHHFTNIHELNTSFTIQFQCFQLAKGEHELSIFSGTIIIEVDIYQLPPTYYNQWKSDEKSSKFVELLSNKHQTIGTEDNGMINVNLKVKGSYPGKWALGILLNGIPSKPVLFTTNMPVTALNIVTQGIYGDLIVARNIGRILPSFAIQLTAPGMNFSQVSYTVIAIAEGYAEDDYGMIDLFCNTKSSFTDHPTFVPMVLTRETQSNSTGFAIFNEVTMMDIQNVEDCFKLKFLVGEPGLYIASELSHPFCYTNDYQYSILPTYSKIIGEEHLFHEKLALKVSLKPVLGNDISEPAMHIYSALPATINELEIPQNEALDYGYKYLENNICLFAGSTCIHGGCVMDGLLENIEEPFSATIHFDNLIWTKPSIKDKFSLRLLNYLPNINSPNTSVITVTTIPTRIKYISQPPKIIEIGEIFHIVLKAMLGDGEGLPHSTITTNITQTVHVHNLDETQKDNIINLFGNQQTEIDQLSLIYRESRVILDPQRAKGITDLAGIGKMNLKFLSGKSGYYALIFQSGSVKSDASNMFYLKNPISEVVYNNSEDLEQKIQVEFDQENEEYLPTAKELAVLPIVKLIPVNIYDAADVENKSENFEIYIVNKIKVEKAKRVMEDINLNTKNLSLNDIYTYSEHGKASTASEQVANLWNLISKGAQTVGNINMHTNDLEIYFVHPTEISSGVYNFTNITIKWKKPGEFYLIVIVNGIETKLSSIITIINKKTTSSEYFIIIFENIFTFGIFLMAILMNIAKISKYLKLATLILEVTYFGIIHMTQRTEVYMYLTYITLGILFIATLRSFLDELCRNQETAHYIVRFQVFMEYTYQRLFMKISNNWNISRKIEVNMKRVIATPIDDSPKERPQNNNELSFGRDREAGDGAIFSQNYQSIHKSSRKINKFPIYTDGSIGRKIKWIIHPFKRNLKEDILVDAMFYPTRFITPLLLGIIIFISFAVIVVTIFTALIDKLSGLRIDIKIALNKFLMAAVTSGRIILNYEFTDEDLEPFYSIVNDINDQLIIFENALRIAFIIAIVVAVIIILGAFISIIFDFKLQVIKLRSGNCDLDYIQAGIDDAGDFPGKFISNAVIAFLVIIIMITLLGAIMLHPLFWQVIWEQRMAILMFLIPYLISVIEEAILDQFTYNKESDIIRQRGLAQVTEFVNFFLLILGGALTSIFRFFIALLGLFIGMARMERPLLAAWFLKIYYFDSANKSYIGMLNAYHQFNNPIAYSFKECLYLAMAEKSRFMISLVENNSDPDHVEKECQKRERLIRVRNKFLVALLLVKNPRLALRRKKYIKSLEEERLLVLNHDTINKGENLAEHGGDNELEEGETPERINASNEVFSEGF